MSSTAQSKVGYLAIGTSTAPSYPLDVVGTIQATGLKIPTGAGLNKVLSSDASGVASWQTAAGGSGTVTNFVFTNSTGITGTVATPTITPTLSLALTSAAVGLGNVTNESKATMFTSPTFTGTPAAPTAAAGTNTTQLATTAFVKTACSPTSWTCIIVTSACTLGGVAKGCTSGYRLISGACRAFSDSACTLAYSPTWAWMGTSDMTNWNCFLVLGTGYITATAYCCK